MRQHALGSHGRNGAQHFGLLFAHSLGFKARRRLHRHQRQQLQDVVGHHVAQRARCVVVPAAAFHTDRLGHRDLHIVDVAPVPDRLEHAVAEAEHQDVLHGLFAEVVIDAEDLVFAQGLAQVAVELLGRIEIDAERLLDDHTPPAMRGGITRTLAFAHQTRSTELLDDGREVLGRGGQVKETVAARAVALLGVEELLFQAHIRSRIVEVARHIAHTRQHRFDDVARQIVRFVALDVLFHARAVGRGVERRAPHTDDAKVRRQQPIMQQVAQSRNQLALRQVPCCAKDDDGGRPYGRGKGIDETVESRIEHGLLLIVHDGLLLSQPFLGSW